MRFFHPKKVKFGSVIIERSAYLLKIHTDKYESERKMFDFTYYTHLTDTDHLFITKIVIPINDITFVYLYPLSLVFETNAKIVSVSIGEMFSISMDNENYIPQSIVDIVHQLQERIQKPNINDIIPLIPDDRKIRMIDDYVREIKDDNGKNDHIIS